MVRNKLSWDASYTVGLQKQSNLQPRSQGLSAYHRETLGTRLRNLYQSSPTFLCFEVPSRYLHPSAHNLFRTM